MVECIVGGCDQEATVDMTLAVVPPRRAQFCEKHARQFEGSWRRVGEPEQLTLGGEQ